MRYRDLIQFEPIESIIQLREADDKEEARRLVQTYVISDRMADQLGNLVFPNLQIDRPADNKGVLIVGNYGTGKSHLLSMLSAVAEHADLAANIRHPELRQRAQSIAGRFHVWRTEIGGVTKSLRNIVLDELEDFLQQVGTPYVFPAADQVSNNKDALIAAMGGFSARYPDQGVLLVVDELLDFLRTRDQRAQILDLGFLRELGEIVGLTPFRLLIGVQETLFDNPLFSFVAEQLRRVRDRFEQVRIAREDIAFVVSERLLRKSDEQIARVGEHLRAFTTLYPPLSDHLGEYARLFPIHPAYIDTFERVYIAEKREVLKTFSQAIDRLLDTEVPGGQPGLISYDHYWDLLRDNPSLRTLPGVVDVVEKSNVLEGRVRNAYTRPHLTAMALRIIHALSVHRLTSEINAPLGVTAEELRDQLCLWTPMPEATAGFLADNVRVALREIMRTVSGQYITYNEDNGQYYLDVKKDIDFDARIVERGAVMDEADLNTYFFDALRPLLNLPTSVYVTGFSIWFYELPWSEHKVTRPGYLFFGAPNERSTAQPPRDFYVYVLPPFTVRTASVAAPPEPQDDEVTFSFHGLDAAFADIVRGYAGARALAHESPNHRDTYDDKADGHARKLSAWLKENFNDHARASYRGVTRTVAEALSQTRSSASQDLNELVRLIAAQLLTPHFEERYPAYPRFSRLAQPITETSRAPNALEAVRAIARGTRTQLATAVLQGLKLLDEADNIKPAGSAYARHFLEKLHAKGENQVVNQGEVLAQVAGGLQPIWKDLQFGLEPEWVAVVLLALVYDGQITLNIGGAETLDAGNVARAATLTLDEITGFRFYARPRDLPLPVWTQVFEGLGLQAGLLRNENERTQAVQQLQAAVRKEMEQVVAWQNSVQNGMRLWNESLFTDRITFGSREGLIETHSDLPVESLSQTDLLPALRKTKEFLETLGRFDTPGKLRNLTLTGPQVGDYLVHRLSSQRIAGVIDLLGRLTPLTAYLSEAQAMLAEGNGWSGQAAAARSELLAALRREAGAGGGWGENGFDLGAWQRRLEGLRQQYVQVYGDLHRGYVLGPADDDRRVQLLRSRAVEQLQILAQIDILNRVEFERWGEALAAIRTCREFHEGLLADAPHCPACSFRPATDAGQLRAGERLEQLQDRLTTMLGQWHAALRQNLQSETAQHSIAGMTPRERQPLATYLALADPAGVALPAGLVAAANNALHGIDTVRLDAAALVEALKAGGLPCTVQELGQRFTTHVTTRMAGHDPRNTRLTLEE